MVPGRAALLGSVVYMMMPYHIWADFYRRFALSECWALVWMPLILFFTARVVARRRLAMTGLGIAFALLVVTHLFTVLMFSIIPLAAATFLPSDGKRIQATLRVAASMLLGIGLSSVYLFSALFHQRYIPAAKLLALSVYNWRDNFLRFGWNLFARPSIATFAWSLSWITLNLFVLAIVCGVVALRWATTETKRTVVFWLVICVFTVFIMSSLSEPLWKLLPGLQAIQFPWRFNLVLCVAASPIIAIFFSKYSWVSRSQEIVISVCIFLMLVPWLLALGDIWRRYRTETRLPNDAMHIVVEDDGLFPAWSPPGIDQASSLKAASGPRVRFTEGAGSVEALVWGPRHIQFQTNSQEGGWVMVNQFYYPAWIARLANRSVPVEIRPSIPEGLVELLVPAGVQEVRLDIPFGLEERMGCWISSSCALLCMYFICRKKPSPVVSVHQEVPY